MLTFAGDAIQSTTDAAATLSYWSVFWWFMLGVVLRQAYKLLGWFKTPADKRTVTLTACLAAKAQGIIFGFVIAWIWVGGHLWELIGILGESVPILKQVPQFSADQLASAGVGFVLEWLIVERLIEQFGVHRKPVGK